MPLSVLQPVERRRRPRRKRRLLLLLLLVTSVTAGSLAVTKPWARPHPTPHARAAPITHAALRPPARPQLAARKRVVLRTLPKPLAQPLLAWPRRVRHAFRPPLGGRAALLVDERTGRVLWAKRPHARLPIASTTKIMTALLALERLPLGRRITVTRKVPRVALVREGLRAGERPPVWKLLYGLLLFSGNDDALTLAIGTSGSRAGFIALMNERAHQLDLRDTHFTTPSGVVDRGNHSSAWDLAALTRYTMRLPSFRKIVRTREIHVRWAAPTYSKIYVNKNNLLRTYRGADGVKTGWTTIAGHCLVASAHRRGVRLLAVVLHSPDPYADARRLLNFGFDYLPE
jgi:D-alanyl-D-alanine carboxypeptidase